MHKPLEDFLEIGEVMSENRPFVNGMKAVGNLTIDAVRTTVADHEEVEKQRARREQREEDVVHAIMAFAELELTKDKVMDLLYRYFNIESIPEAKSLIKLGMQIEYPIFKLDEYLTDSGYPDFKIQKFMKENKVREMLRREPDLADLSPVELKQHFE